MSKTKATRIDIGLDCRSEEIRPTCSVPWKKLDAMDLSNARIVLTLELGEDGTKEFHGLKEILVDGLVYPEVVTRVRKVIGR